MDIVTSSITFDYMAKLEALNDLKDTLEEKELWYRRKATSSTSTFLDHADGIREAIGAINGMIGAYEELANEEAGRQYQVHLKDMEAIRILQGYELEVK